MKRIKYSKKIDAGPLQKLSQGHDDDETHKVLNSYSASVQDCSCGRKPVSFIDFDHHHFLTDQVLVPGETASEEEEANASEEAAGSGTSMEVPQMGNTQKSEDVAISVSDEATYI